MMEAKRTAWQNSKWRLDIYELEKPDGERVETAVVRHSGAVVLVPITATGKVLMLRQYRLPLDQIILEIPAGTRESKEEPWLECAQRELREETGFRADNFVDLGILWPIPGSSDEEQKIFLATGLIPDPLPQDFDEQIEVVEMELDELCAMALDGRMRDTKSGISLLRVKHYLDSEQLP
ncbi:MAG: NUDIX hydrolase [Chloroflexota bacterium]